MKLRLLFWLLTAPWTFAVGQTVLHPWHTLTSDGRSSAGALSLQSAAGQPAAAAMRAGGTWNEGGYIPGLRLISATTAAITVQSATGWNLVSIPLTLQDMRVPTLFPSATSQAFSYEGSYAASDTLRTGVGYWVKLPLPETSLYSGTGIVHDTIDVRDSWNMIGSLSFPLLASAIQAIPPTTVSSGYFAYANGAYQLVDTVLPGNGYWIKVSHAGKLVLSTGSVLMSPQNPPMASGRARMSADGIAPQLGSIIFTDPANRSQTLVFATDASDTGLASFELPPPPPPGSFDVRFGTQRSKAVASPGNPGGIPILVTSSMYPLTVRWHAPLSAAATLFIGGKETLLNGDGMLRIDRPMSTLRLRLAASPGPALPRDFALHQNYPNPFNPATTIRFDLPSPAYVTLSIYNALGQRVTTIVDGLRDAGYQSADWGSVDNQGNAVASGMYFCRLEAHSAEDPFRGFSDVRKMLLIR